MAWVMLRLIGLMMRVCRHLITPLRSRPGRFVWRRTSQSVRPWTDQVSTGRTRSTLLVSFFFRVDGIMHGTGVHENPWMEPIIGRRTIRIARGGTPATSYRSPLNRVTSLVQLVRSFMGSGNCRSSRHQSGFVRVGVRSKQVGGE